MGGNGKGRPGAAGPANLAKWKEKNPSGGNLKHGAYSKHFRKRYTDARTMEGRALRAAMDELRADLGTVSAGQSLILGRVREKLIVLMQIGAYVDKQPSAVNEKGELIGCLRYGYGMFSEALRRDVALLYALAGKRSGRVPDLAGYLKEKRGAKC